MHEKAALSYLPIRLTNRKRSEEFKGDWLPVLFETFSEPGYPAVP